MGRYHGCVIVVMYVHNGRPLEHIIDFLLYNIN